jgi:tRNA threonylcarbamoyladenosine biosynthesis protein TsaB
MKILGIDTTTKFSSIGVYDGTKVYAYNLEVGRELSSLLAPTIKRILDTLGWQASDIDYFACGLGPGSFTGMRVGLATIKGLAWSLNKPIIGISTLDILAANIKAVDAKVIPMIDAKRNLIYCSVYKTKGSMQKRITPYLLLTEDEFFKKMKAKSIIFGDAVPFYKEKILRNIKGVTILDRDYWYPQGQNIIELALERIRAKRFSNSFKTKPIYLYPKECQIKNAKFKN